MRHRLHHVAGAARGQQFQQFGAHALAREAIEKAARRNACMQCMRIHLALAISGVKAKEAEDSQIIFRNTRGCIADEAHAARGHIRHAARVIMQAPVRIHRHLVDG